MSISLYFKIILIKYEYSKKSGIVIKVNFALFLCIEQKCRSPPNTTNFNLCDWRFIFYGYKF